jgi:predicted methyltransferase
MNARLVCALAITLALTACSRSESPAPAAETPPPAAHAATPGESTGESAAIQAALSNPSRFAGDAGEDAWRKSADVLAFMNVQPGMHVVDYLAGGGYYTELLSMLVGPEGRVYTYNNAEYTKYSGDTPAKRYANNRLGNVVTVTGAPESLAIEPSSLDAALFVQSYHDLHWKSKDWTPTDPAKSLAALVAALKPGATVVVVDHVAVAGSDPAVVVDSLHRIDPALVRKEFEAAGLVFDAESSILANSADDHTKSVFDESIRHKTDQFVYRFRKP